MSGANEKTHIFVVPPFQTREARAFPPEPSSPAARQAPPGIAPTALGFLSRRRRRFGVTSILRPCRRYRNSVQSSQRANDFEKRSLPVYFYSHEPNESPHVHIDRDDRSAKFWLRPLHSLEILALAGLSFVGENY
jgi:Domain of unknown function (DUF4160)